MPSEHTPLPAGTTDESSRAAAAQDYPERLRRKPVLKLMFAALVCAAERWRGLRFTEFGH
jgi:hypothetical protein